jgi:hypothetical protein
MTINPTQSEVIEIYRRFYHFCKGSGGFQLACAAVCFLEKHIKGWHVQTYAIEWYDVRKTQLNVNGRIDTITGEAANDVSF